MKIPAIMNASHHTNLTDTPLETGLPTPHLDLSPAAANAQFEKLQRKLVPLWESIRSFNQDEQTIVVVPSIDVDLSLIHI